MRNRRDWHEIRSTHARVLEALEQAVAAHPAGAGKARRGGANRKPVIQAVPGAGDRAEGAGGAAVTDVTDGAVGTTGRPVLRTVGGREAAGDPVVVPFRPRAVALLPRANDIEHDPDDPTAA